MAPVAPIIVPETLNMVREVQNNPQETPYLVPTSKNTLPETHHIAP